MRVPMGRGSSHRAGATALLVAGVAASIGCGLDLEAAFTQLVEARRLAAEMRVSLHRAAASAQHAVMADDDDAAAGFVREAEKATRSLERDLASIAPMLERLRYPEELCLVREFEASFAELRDLDRSLFALAVGNTNAKAQRLSFGPAREEADGFCAALEGLARSAPEPVALARERLERFSAIHRELVSLSRQNTEVRSLAVVLGRRRNPTDVCDATLVALQEALARRGLGSRR